MVCYEKWLGKLFWLLGDAGWKYSTANFWKWLWCLSVRNRNGFLHIFLTNSPQPPDGRPQGEQSWLHLNNCLLQIIFRNMGSCGFFSPYNNPWQWRKKPYWFPKWERSFSSISEKVKASSFASSKVSFLQLNTLENCHFGITLFPGMGIFLLRLVKLSQK